MNENILNLPENYPKQDFNRNLIKITVCELRFPIILELETRPPAKLHSAIRKEYPHYEKRKKEKLLREKDDVLNDINRINGSIYTISGIRKEYETEQ